MQRACSVALGLFVVVAVAPAASAAELWDVRLTRGEGTVSVELRLSALPPHRSELIGGPWRIVLDLQGATYRWRAQPLVVRVDPVKEIRGSQYRRGIVRLVIELTRRVPYVVEPWGGGLRVVLGAPSRAAHQPELQGIVIRDDGPVAYIVAPGATRAEGYRIGDAVGGSVVEAIDEEGVVLRGPSGRVVLRLDVSKPPPSR